jgi:hypothetical protein
VPAGKADPGQVAAGTGSSASKSADAAFDLIPDRPHILHAVAGGVVEDPVEVALAGKDGAGVAAAHRVRRRQ